MHVRVFLSAATNNVTTSRNNNPFITTQIAVSVTSYFSDWCLFINLVRVTADVQRINCAHIYIKVVQLYNTRFYHGQLENNKIFESLFTAKQISQISARPLATIMLTRHWVWRCKIKIAQNTYERSREVGEPLFPLEMWTTYAVHWSNSWVMWVITIFSWCDHRSRSCPMNAGWLELKIVDQWSIRIPHPRPQKFERPVWPPPIDLEMVCQSSSPLGLYLYHIKYGLYLCHIIHEIGNEPQIGHGMHGVTGRRTQ